MLSDNVYRKLSGKVQRIYKMVKPMHHEAGEIPPLTQLVEIERFIEDSVRFMQISSDRNKLRIDQHIKT